jgi:hypothetical protein
MTHPEMNEELTFTREDADRITRMETLLIGMDQKIDKLASSIGACQSVCAARRKKFSERVDLIEKQHTEEKGVLKGRTADVALGLGVISLVGVLLGIWRSISS